MSRVRDLENKSQNIFFKNGFRKWGAINRKLFDLPRSKILYFHFFFQKNFEIFLYRASGTLKKKSQNIFLKNGFQKWGAVDRKLFYSPRSITCKMIFLKKFKNLIGGEFKEKTEKKNVVFFFYL